MPIVFTDIQYKLSIPSAPAGNTTPSTAAQSLGGFISTTQFFGGFDSLFPDMSGDNNANFVSDYYCIFVHNTNPTYIYRGAVVWFKEHNIPGSTIGLGIDPIGVVDANSGFAQATIIVNSNTVPAGIIFSAPAQKSAGVFIGDMAPNAVQAIWLSRTGANINAINNDGFLLGVSGQTDA